jgi:flagellar hook-associated protein 2
VAGMTVDGMISGLDTTSLINSLVQAEGAPQAQLKTKLSTTTASAVAYRSINTRFDAVRTAAEALTKADVWATAKVTSSSESVVAGLGSAPQTGTLVVNVTAVAATHAMASNDRWAALDAPANFTSLDITIGATTTTITVGATATLDEAVKAINDSGVKVSASTVQVAPGQYALLLSADESGLAASFAVTASAGAGVGAGFALTDQGADAKLTMGTTANALEVTSSTNTFTGLMPGLTLTVREPKNGVTVSVTADPDAIAAKVKSLVDAVNSALGGIKTYTSAAGGPTAVLKGDSGLMTLAGRVLNSISYAVGTSGSPAAGGLQLNKDGTVAFDSATFIEKIKADPTLVQKLFTGTPADGATEAVPGVVQRVHELAKATTDTTTGTLTMLAKGRDSLAKDIQTRIEAWDLRLAQRRETLTRQFTAMETALSSMKNQSTWLAGQISSLSSS